MTDLHQIFDSLVGYLIGMAFIEAILKPTIVRLTKKTVKTIDEQVGVLPDWLYEEKTTD